METTHKPSLEPMFLNSERSRFKGRPLKEIMWPSRSHRKLSVHASQYPMENLMKAEEETAVAEAVPASYFVSLSLAGFRINLLYSVKSDGEHNISVMSSWGGCKSNRILSRAIHEYRVFANLKRFNDTFSMKWTPFNSSDGDASPRRLRGNSLVVSIAYTRNPPKRYNSRTISNTVPRMPMPPPVPHRE